MRTSLILHLTLSSMVLMPATAAIAAPDAAGQAARAEKALDRNKPAVAIGHAESAVASAPNDVRYRMLLARAYLGSGRLRSAAESFADALALDPTQGSAALNLAMARLALGDRDGAKTVLADHGAQLPASDHGLALALTGDAASGIALLEGAVREGLADARTRQNLGLAYAMAGRWAEAKLVASYDLDPATLSQRIMQWSQFTREEAVPAQGASLLGVTPVEDAGRPERLALTVQPTPTVLVAEAAPPPPVAMTETVVPEPVIVAEPVATAAVTTVAMTPVVPVPAAPFVRVGKTAVSPLLVKPNGGRYVVQIGAFDSMGVAQAAWTRTASRIGALKSFTPSTTTLTRGSATYYRLSLAGFGTRSVAATFCEQLRTRGASCFVREAAGDAPLRWAGRSAGVRFAAR